MGLQEDWDSATPDLSAEWDAAAPDNQSAEAPQASAPPEPSMGDVALNAVPKGVANLLHTPNMITSLVLKGLSSIPGMEDVPGLKELGDRFARNGIMELMQKGGLVDPNKEPQTGPQRIVDMAIQAAVGSAMVPGMGAVNAAKSAAMGAVSGAAAQGTKEVTGSDLLAAAAGMVAPFAMKSAANAVSTSSKKILLNETGKMTLQEAQKHGYVVEPSQVRQPTSKLETIAGKAAIAQEASLKNQAVTNRLAARSIGLPDDTPLSMGVIEEVRGVAGKVYKEVADLSPTAAKALDGLKQARFEASDYFRYYNKTGDPAAGKKARAWQAKAAAFEKTIEEEARKIVDVYGVRQGGSSPRFGNRPQVESRAVSTGREVGQPAGPINLEKVGETTAGAPDLMERLKASRQLIARTHDVELALNLGDGNVSAQIIGRMMDQGRPLSGELRTIGKFAQAFPRVTRDASTIPPSGVSGTDAAMSATLGLGGAAASGSPAGLAAAGLPLLRNPAKRHLLSEKYQEMLLKQPSRYNVTIPPSASLASSLITGKTVLDNAEASE